MAKNWIAGAIKHKGALHSMLNVPQGQKIPASKLASAAKSSNPLLKKRAILAKTLKKMHKGKGGPGFPARKIAYSMDAIADPVNIAKEASTVKSIKDSAGRLHRTGSLGMDAITDPVSLINRRPMPSKKGAIVKKAVGKAADNVRDFARGVKEVSEPVTKPVGKFVDKYANPIGNLIKVGKAARVGDVIGNVKNYDPKLGENHALAKLGRFHKASDNFDNTKKSK